MPAPDSAYHGQKIANTHLKYDVFVTPSIPVVTTDFTPGEHERPGPPISSTSIYGLQDAVLVAGSNCRNTGALPSPHFPARCRKSTGGSFG